ncbi:MAG TPA: MCE family protein [Mycobacterium sp.]|nr:MCE family protein [Mycobacterium sp.]
MRRFSERNPVLVGAVGVAVVTAAVLAALEYDKLPFINDGNKYSAYFTEAAGLSAGSPVQVAGYRVGQVSDVGLDGSRVLVHFTVDRAIRLGERTEAAIKTKTLLGARLLAVSPRGEGQLRGPIPTERTSAPYELPQAIGDLSAAISGLDTGQLNTALTTLAQTFQDTPADVRAAFDGVARLSDTLGRRDDKLRSLLANANKVTAVFAQRSDQFVTLATDANALLAELRAQSGALAQISSNISALSKQLSGLVADNNTQLRPALDKLNGVLTMLDNHKQQLQESLKLLNGFSLSLGEAVSSGPFFKAYIANLPPGELMQPFVDAAFSDLGLDPHVLLPSQLTDPQIGQPATPGLPMPYPRTGQGGDPRQTLPDAITGKPGDPRYPYREPPAQPAPGGPPPGPPAGYDPATPATPQPGPTEVEVAPSAPLPPLPGTSR